MKKAVFLDRDGVINDNSIPVNKPEDLKIYPWTSEAISKLNKAGYYVFVITNQGGIEMGYFTENDLKNIHNKMIKEINLGGGIIDDIEYCPHFKTKCECRKPSSGMIIKLAKKYNIKLSQSYMIGDRDVDIEAGINAGCKTIKIGENYKRADYTAKNLLEAVNIILKK
ncbi:D-glycero-D-manno-heptose 1,7-bisphosphate phosphatase [Caminicella sporogenes DSM 14501]|uniref:D,D-heptose 1,7-bisphosphate phosphatase n=1 Tax=Caminicella sporogenes DSM 14501 TaxID=1121266 RepID=A0A1M6MGY8_9FIRM|nr:HAD family hydrolase [Caminicella sporogenes]RKD27554.1 D-glycero-beta-D-manno-heptose-1,7-bisphosphate 7-phosphatase [Caminicella sporogenes]SHJ82732.1 D-glycero-D-manno-heptose 1,7-bisphosphate phosphatase [Caminicella sporogenes DSM 14501]